MKHVIAGLMCASVLSSAASAAPAGLASRANMRHNDIQPTGYLDALPAAAPAPVQQEYQVADAGSYPAGVTSTSYVPYYTPPAALEPRAGDYFRPTTDELLSPALSGQELQQQPQPLMPVAEPAAQDDVYITHDAPESMAPMNNGQLAAEPAQPLPVAEAAPYQEVQAAEAPAGPAGPAGPWQPAVLPNYIEGGLNYHDLTDGQGNWFGQYGRAEIQTDLYNRWNFDLLHQRAFNDSGVYGAIGNTHTFDENWYSDVTVGAGTDAFFLPQLRVDAFLNRKWLEDKSFITTIGAGYYKAQDEHKDGSLFFGTTWYFMPRWSFQNGVRMNWSAPGGVFSPSAFLALTEGAQGEYFLTVRYGFGREAYQIIGPGNTISDFTSNTLSLDWKHWLDTDWGYRIRAEHYGNPNYDRNGGSIGVFKEF